MLLRRYLRLENCAIATNVHANPRVQQIPYYFKFLLFNRARSISGRNDDVSRARKKNDAVSSDAGRPRRPRLHFIYAALSDMHVFRLDNAEGEFVG